MKTGFRTPSPKRSFSARTTGKINRSAKRAVNPLYGKKGVGYIKNPRKAAYNKVYNKTTVGMKDLVSKNNSASNSVSNTFSNATFDYTEQVKLDIRNAKSKVNQLNKCAEIMNKTTNVSIFFDKFNAALNICDDLKKYEYTGCIENMSPSQQKLDLMRQIPYTINQLIVNCHEKAVLKAAELKTEKGKHNRLIRFFNDLINDLKQYGSEYITTSNITELQSLIDEDGLTQNIQINITPKTLLTPTVETPIQNTSISVSTSAVKPDNQTYTLPERDIKKMCLNCGCFFINRSNCPDCGCTLVDADSSDASWYINEKKANKYTTILIALFLLPMVLIGIFLWSLEFHKISLVFFITYMITVVIAHLCSKNNS